MPTDAETGTLPSIDDFHTLVYARRSVRSFDRNRDVPEDYIQRMIDAARLAPSAGNGQPWHFLVVRDPADRAWNADLYMKQQEQKREMEIAFRGQVRMTGPAWRHAPVHVLVLGDPRIEESYPIRTMLDKGARHYHSSLAIATSYLMLAARSLGLGTQYVSDASSPYMATMLKARYGIPLALDVYELIPVGWPDIDVKPVPRRPLESMVHHGRFDPALYLSDEAMHQFLWQDSRLGAYGKGAAPAAQQAGMVEDESGKTK
jgi:nitroreductase